MLSIIIPTLNAADRLHMCLEALGNASEIHEIIVIDGGSSDDSCAIAKAAGANLMPSDPGRAKQMIAGAAAATGDWLLYLHGDTVLDPNWLAATAEFQRANPDKAGYYRFSFEQLSVRNKIWQYGVRFRCWFLNLPYGDQGLLISRALYNDVGGFRPLPFLEDVDMVRRLGRRRLSPIGAVAKTSAVRFRRDGYFKRSAKNLFIVAMFYLGRRADKLANYYR